MLIQSHLSPDLFGMYYPKFGSTTIYKVKKNSGIHIYMYIYIFYICYVVLLGYL